MAKKSFKENPALHFINPVEEPTPTNIKPQPSLGQAGIEAAPPLKLNPLYVETKSKRVQLLMQPSLHQKLKALAVSEGQSFNELVHSILMAKVDN